MEISVKGKGFPGGSVVKNPPTNAGDSRDMDLIPGLGRSPERGNGTPLQYSCLENPTDRGAWQATVHEVTERVRHDLLTKQQQKMFMVKWQTRTASCSPRRSNINSAPQPVSLKQVLDSYVQRERLQGLPWWSSG